MRSISVSMQQIAFGMLLMLYSIYGFGAEDRLSDDEAQAWLEATLAEQLSINDVVGAAAAMVRDGEIIASVGVGLSDRDQAVAVDPSLSLFRLGSISKTVTAAAVLQLVERGELNLDQSIDEYVAFDTSWAIERPITLRHLLTHTAGFSDVYRQLFTLDKADNPDLADYVYTLRPSILFEPGSISAYSNYGISLAGYIVELTSGLAFSDYVQQNIFEPLGMTSASMAQPLVIEDGYHWPLGYSSSGTVIQFEYIGGNPAGALSATVEDYARFMAMILNEGEYRGVRILQSESVREMLRPQGMDPGSRASGQGFALTWFVSGAAQGELTLTHGGDTMMFHSLAKVFPGQNLAMVVTQNTEHGSVAPAVLSAFESLIELPQAPILREVPDATDNQRVAGEYFNSRYSGHGILSLSKLLQAGRSVVALPDGGIRIGKHNEYRRVAPRSYQQVDRPDRRVTFFEDSRGRIVQSSNGLRPLSVFETMGFVASQLAVTGLVLLCAAIAGIRSFALAFSGRRSPARLALVAGSGSLLILLGFALYVSQVIGIQSDFYSMTAARDPAFRVSQAFMVSGLLLLLTFLGSCVRSLSSGDLHGIKRALSVLVILAGVSAGAFMLVWNLLSISLAY